MVKLILLALVAALLLYLGLKEESKELSIQSTPKVQTAQEEPEKIDKQKRSRTQEERKKEELEKPLKEEETIIDTEEEDEPDEEIAEDERAEDHYRKSDVPPQGNLVGGADVEWIEPDKSEKPGGKFGLPPPTF